jgi:hypothetical protein
MENQCFGLLALLLVCSRSLDEERSFMAAPGALSISGFSPVVRAPMRYNRSHDEAGTKLFITSSHTACIPPR